MADLLFYALAVIALLCAGGLAVVRHPISGAMNLVGVMLSLAGIYGLLAAPVLGIVQILVYAGAIMMLIVFVIMILGGALDHRIPRTSRGRALVALPCGLGFAALVLLIFQHSQLAPGETAGEVPIRAFGTVLFTVVDGQGFYLLFELTGLILLAAMVGAIMLAKRELGVDEETCDAV